MYISPKTECSTYSCSPSEMPTHSHLRSNTSTCNLTSLWTQLWIFVRGSIHELLITSPCLQSIHSQARRVYQNLSTPVLHRLWNVDPFLVFGLITIDTSNKHWTSRHFIVDGQLCSMNAVLLQTALLSAPACNWLPWWSAPRLCRQPLLVYKIWEYQQLILPMLLSTSSTTATGRPIEFACEECAGCTYRQWAFSYWTSSLSIMYPDSIADEWLHLRFLRYPLSFACYCITCMVSAPCQMCTCSRFERYAGVRESDRRENSMANRSSRKTGQLGRSCVIRDATNIYTSGTRSCMRHFRKPITAILKNRSVAAAEERTIPWLLVD